MQPNDSNHGSQPPAVPAYQASPVPGSMVTPPAGQPFTPLPAMQPPRKSKAPWIILAVVGGLVLLAGGTTVLAYLKSSGANKASSDLPGVNFPSVGSLTASSVASLNKDDLFWGYFANAELQAKTVTTNDISYYDYSEAQGHTRPLSHKIAKAGIDYSTGKFVEADDEYGVDTTGGINLDINGDNYASSVVDTQSRCLGSGQPVQKRTSVAGGYSAWQPVKDLPCTIQDAGQYFGGGINAGGLTAKQAAAFTGVLRAQNGLMRVDKLELVTKAGKPYLHFTVTMTPTTAAGDTTDYEGLGWLDAAFGETHLDTSTHPYAYIGGVASGSGAQLEYYVDPASKLPAYSELSDTPYYDAHGKPVAPVSQTVQKTTYQFGVAGFDASTANTSFLKFQGW